MNYLFINVSFATLAAGIASGATSAVMASSSGVFDSATPQKPCRVRIWNSTDYAHPALDPNSELIDIQGASGLSLTSLLRGREGTTDNNHNDAGKTYTIAAVVTSGMLDEIQLSLPTTYAGDPNGNVDGYPGRMCYDTTNQVQYVKNSPIGTLTGWE